MRDVMRMWKLFLQTISNENENRSLGVFSVTVATEWSLRAPVIVMRRALMTGGSLLPGIAASASFFYTHRYVERSMGDVRSVRSQALGARRWTLSAMRLSESKCA